MKIQILIFLAVCAGAFAQSSQAQMLTSTTDGDRHGTAVIGAALMNSQIDYDFEGGDSEEIDRAIIAGIGSYGLNNKLRLLGQLGLIFDSESGSGMSKFEGDGFLFGGGASYELYSEDKLRVFGHGLLNFVFEDFESDVGNVDLEFNVTDMHLGAMADFTINQTVGIYGGLDIVFYSDGEYEVDGGADGEVERDDIMNFVVGAAIDLKGILLRPGLSFGGEQSIMIAVQSGL